MEFDRHIRRLYLDKLQKDLQEWEHFKRSMKSLLESMKGSMDYDDYLTLYAQWDQYRKGIDNMMEKLIG